MREENAFLSDEQAHHPHHPQRESQRGRHWSWKFDNYVRTFAP